MFDYCEKNCYSTNIMCAIHHQEYQKTYVIFEVYNPLNLEILDALPPDGVNVCVLIDQVTPSLTVCVDDETHPEV